MDILRRLFSVLKGSNAPLEALELESKRDYESAARHYVARLRKHPNDAGLRFAYISTVWEIKGRRDEFFSECDLAFRRYADRMNKEQLAILYGMRGNAYAEREDFRNALSDLKMCISLAPNDTFGYTTRAEILLQMGEADAALADYEQARRISPQTNAEVRNSPNKLRAAALKARATAYEGLQQYSQAIEDCNAALQLTPDDADLYNIRAFLYRMVEQFEAAIADGTEAIRLQPRETAFYANRALAYRGWKRLDDAITDLNQAIQRGLGQLQSYQWRGEIYYDCNRFTEAIADYTTVLRFKPKDSVALFHRARVYSRLHEFNQALADNDAYIALHPDLPEGYTNRAIIHQKLGNIEAALADHAQALQVYPSGVLEQYNNLYNLFDPDQAEQTLVKFEALARQHPEHPLPIDGIGIINYLLGRYQIALDLHLRARELPMPPPIHRSPSANKLSEALYRYALGERENAYRLWSSVVDENPNYRDPAWVLLEHAYLPQIASDIRRMIDDLRRDDQPLS